MLTMDKENGCGKMRGEMLENNYLKKIKDIN